MDDEPLSENLFVRMPAGTKARIEAARGFEPQSAWLRRVILAALPDKPAEKRKRPVAKRRA
jgi:hypothetical protein